MSLRVRLQSFLPARGLAIGAKADNFFFSFSLCADLSASLSLPISLCPSQELTHSLTHSREFQQIPDKGLGFMAEKLGFRLYL